MALGLWLHYSYVALVAAHGMSRSAAWHVMPSTFAIDNVLVLICNATLDLETAYDTIIIWVLYTLIVQGVLLLEGLEPRTEEPKSSKS